MASEDKDFFLSMRSSDDSRHTRLAERRRLLDSELPQGSGPSSSGSAAAMTASGLHPSSTTTPSTGDNQQGSSGRKKRKGNETDTPTKRPGPAGRANPRPSRPRRSVPSSGPTAEQQPTDADDQDDQTVEVEEVAADVSSLQLRIAEQSASESTNGNISNLSPEKSEQLQEWFRYLRDLNTENFNRWWNQQLQIGSKCLGCKCKTKKDSDWRGLDGGDGYACETCLRAMRPCVRQELVSTADNRMKPVYEVLPAPGSQGMDAFEYWGAAPRGS